jgi:hypothetical protein
VDHVPDPLLLRKNLIAPGIEPGPLDVVNDLEGTCCNHFQDLIFVDVQKAK